MPADYSSTAQALSIPTSTIGSSSPTTSSSPSPVHSPTCRSPSPSPFPHSDDDGDVPVPPWVRSSSAIRPGGGSRRPLGSGTTAISINSRRLSNPYSRVPRRQAFGRRVLSSSLTALNNAARLLQGMSVGQLALASLAGAAALTALVLVLVYSHRIFAWLAPVAEGWRALPGGWVLVFLLTCATAFPPMIGYSTCLTVSGFVYGFPGGWPVVAAATVFGSTAAFVASRTVLSRYVHRLVGADRRFVALGQVLRHDGLLVLAGLRFCPLPFSLSNGFLATIPSISPLGFALATALATPKLLVHVFIGSRLAKLAESGDKMTVGDKAVNYLSMLVGSAVGLVVGLVVYRRTMARAEQLAREELEAGTGGGPVIDDRLRDDYGDLEEDLVAAQLLGEADEAALMSEDDISLWAREDGGIADAEDLDAEELRDGYRDGSDDGGRYRDEFEDDRIGGDGSLKKKHANGQI
ncbi:hypothetical protein DL764_008827 [Monosporascus ibericus]|uniref:Golgi apparatus membrane protein TVP38 n=1 Tax=Monosporascus ibericus TaxID=155417 RepID=A0A4Q4SWI7_9PEZI|nr:hypothetical protein DL764_008827 [Monosporascus ibericus]